MITPLFIVNMHTDDPAIITILFVCHLSSVPIRPLAMMYAAYVIEEPKASIVPLNENAHSFISKKPPANTVPIRMKKMVVNSIFEDFLEKISHSSKMLNHVNCIRIMIANDAGIYWTDS